jgi:hypothetical protein
MCEDRPFNTQAALENLIEQYDKEAKDACTQSANSITEKREFYYMGVDSALTGVLADLGSLLNKVIINKSEANCGGRQAV